MPSQLASLLTRTQQSQLLASPNEQEVLVDAWRGYWPSVEPVLAGLDAMAPGSFGLLPHGESLTHEVGWTRVDPDRLPLGDLLGAAESPATINPQAIQHLSLFERTSALGSELVAATRDASVTSGENSHIFKLPGSAAWTNVPPRGGYPVGVDLPTSTALSYASSGGFVDSAVLSLGVPSGSPYAAAAGRGAINQPVHFLVNPNNLVAMWPCFRFSEVDEYDYPIEAIGALSTFRAASVEAFDGRICYLNWSDSTGNHPQSMAFSVVGDGTDIDVGSVGAGRIIADEMAGEGVRILRLGDMLAGYFTSGVVLYQKFQPPLAPFQLQYLTTQISILSMRSVCAIDRDRHFLLADEGWFIIDSTGSIVEVGATNTEGGAFVRKWISEFFSILNRNSVRNVSVTFNGVQRLVRISFPAAESKTANTVWYYEPDSDRVWPAASYGDQAVHSQVVAPSLVSSSAAWSAMSASWSGTSKRWSSFAARLGFEVGYHGARSGYVYVQSEGKGHLREQPDGSDDIPGYNYVTHEVPIDGPHLWKAAGRLDVEYENVGAGDAQLTVVVDGATQSVTRSVTEGAADQASVAYMVAAGLGGTHHGFRVSGLSPVAIRRFRYTYTPRLGQRKQYRLL